MCHLHDLLCLSHAVIVTCKSLTIPVVGDVHEPHKHNYSVQKQTTCQLCNRHANLEGAGVIQSLVRGLELK